MRRKVWVFRRQEQVADSGEGASWYVGYYDDTGKRRKESCGPGPEGKKKAERRARQIEGQLEAGTYRPAYKTTWQEFRERYESNVLACKRPSTQRHYRDALDNFERIAKPGRLASVAAETIDKFVASRLQERGYDRDTLGDRLPVSRATVNHDLRVVKLFLRTAHEWDLIPRVPRIRMLKELRKQIRIVPSEQFNAIFEAAETARFPRHQGQNYTPGDWWRALLATGYLTGMRIGELLSLQTTDVDLDAGTYRTRAEDNKAGRDETLPLHPVAVKYLRAIRGFGPLVFPWEYHSRTLYAEFHRIQSAAGITGRPYGFHDLRRSFGSIQATRVEAAVLKRLMRHSSVATTLKFYVNVDDALRTAVNSTPVPSAMRAAL